MGGSECSCAAYGAAGAYKSSTLAYCSPCPTGAVCSGAHPPLALPGFWHAPGGARATFYGCPKGVCLGEANATASGVNCRPGHTGVLCAVCEAGFARRGGTFCQPCEDAAPAHQFALLLLKRTAFLFLASLYLLYPLSPPGLQAFLLSAAASRLPAWVQRRLIPRASPRPSGAVQLVGRLFTLGGVLLEPFKVVLDALQLVTLLTHTVDVPWPDLHTRAVAALEMLNFEFIEFGDAEAEAAAACAPRASHHERPRFAFLLDGLAPASAAALLALAAFGAAAWAVASARGVPLARRRLFAATLLGTALGCIDLVYQPVSERVLGAFVCRDVGLGGARFLASDLSQLCAGPAHAARRRNAAFWALVFPVGVPLLYLRLLVWYRVPAAAAALADAAALRRLVDLAWQRRVKQPDAIVSSLTPDTITEEHVAMLYAGILGTAQPSGGGGGAEDDRDGASDAPAAAPGPPLPTAEHVRHVQATWGVAVGDDVTPLGVASMTFFFAARPEALAHFSFDASCLEDLDSPTVAPKLRRHAATLLHAVGSAVGSLEDLETLVPVLVKLGRAHARFPFDVASYAGDLRDALVAALSQRLGAELSAFGVSVIKILNPDTHFSHNSVRRRVRRLERCFRRGGALLCRRPG